MSWLGQWFCVVLWGGGGRVGVSASQSNDLYIVEGPLSYFSTFADRGSTRVQVRNSDA
jgi:hypothetical protein